MHVHQNRIRDVGREMYVLSWFQEDASLLGAAVDTVFGLDGVEPMALELALPDRPVTPYWAAGLVGAGVPVEPDWYYSRISVAEVPRVDRGVALSWARTWALDDQGWECLRVVISRIRLPLPGPWVGIDYHQHRQDLPTEQDASGTWFVGPIDSILRPVPVDVVVTRIADWLKLSLTVRWTAFGDRGAPGRTWLDNLIGSLEARGWELEQRPPDWP